MRLLQDKRLILFLLIAVAIVPVLVLININANFAMLLAALWVIPSFILARRLGAAAPNGDSSDSMRTWTGLWPFTLIPVMAVITVLVTRLVFWIAWDPSGQPDDNGCCLILPDAIDVLPPVANGSDTVATIRRVRAALPIDEGVPYFVFVHRNGAKDSKSNLVFRYYSTGKGEGLPPKLSWLSRRSLIVRVGAGDVLQVTKRLQHIGDVDIRYDLRKTVCHDALHFWERSFWGEHC